MIGDDLNFKKQYMSRIEVLEGTIEKLEETIEDLEDNITQLETTIRKLDGIETEKGAKLDRIEDTLTGVFSENGFNFMGGITVGEIKEKLKNINNIIK